MIPSAVLAASAQNVTAEPSGIGACIRTVGVTVAIPEPVQLQILDHRRPQTPDGLDEPGRRESRRGLARPQDPADLLVALEHEDLLTGLREVGGRDEAVVAAADHDDVERLLRHQAALRPFFFSLRYSSAAIRPGAPMMPPPGCVAEPHIHSLSTGVR